MSSKLVLPENEFAFTLCEVEMYKMGTKVVHLVVLTIYGPSDLLEGPLHYQQNTVTGLYSSKSLNKILLPE